MSTALENFAPGSSASIETSRAGADTGGRSTRSPEARSALLVGSFPAPGAFAPCEGLARALKEAGWGVVTASRKAGRIPRLFDMMRTAWSRRANYAVAQVDVFSGQAFFWAEAVCRLLAQLGKPYVLTLHGGNLPRFGRTAAGRVGRLLASAAAVTTPSRYLKDEMKRFRSDIVLVPNALALEAFPFRQRSAPKARLVWVRAFHETYNPSLAPRILALLAPDFPEATLTMLGRDKGDGSLEETKRVARELGVLQRLKLPGAVPNVDVAKFLDAGDVFLNTTDIDNTPVSVLEAMACGLLVVSTDVGGIPYLLTDGADALLSPARDADAMAAAVRRVLTEQELAPRLSKAARESVMELDWSNVLPQWEEILLRAGLSASVSAPARAARTALPT
ncbi:MAG TPA: glycosyltransferase family 4 protein [Thermoanaerobaculia bacterium]|nr:glycosyltransferase family 4 protein [Thermoanaerobaculia bacterium]